MSRTLAMIEKVSQIALTTQGEGHWPSLVLSNCEIKRTPLRTDKAGLLSKDQSSSLDFRSKVLCLKCVSYFMTLDSVFSFVCGTLCSGEMLIFNRQSALKCDTVSLAQKPDCQTQPLEVSQVCSHHCLAGSKSVTVLTRWREYRTFNICCL